MSVEPGKRLAHYEIAAPLGKGGMGEVYLAKDTKLGRDVAIKILPEEFTNDPERLARFEREARTLASLAHTHIAAIHGFEDVDGVRFLVMQLALGEDLSVRLQRGAIPIDEAIAISKQIAAALEVAHEQGIVHRDLKPANLKVDEHGDVKVLDFGLAKALETEESDEDFTNSPTMVRAATHAGVILGTAAYMSPEQARGKRVDKRADIWAFGVVLWEMLTGERLFEGDTVSDTLAAVLTRVPDLSKLPSSTPRSVRWVLERSLERDPRKRLRDIGEARIALEASNATELPDSGSEEAATRRPATGVVAIAVAGGLLLGVLMTLILMRLQSGQSSAATPEEIRFRIELPELGRVSGMEISPDGRAVAWSVGNTIWVRRLDRIDPRTIEMPWDGEMESWAPDSRSLVVRRRTGGNGELWRISLEGDAPAPIGSLPDDGFLWRVAPGEGDQILVGMADAGIFSLPIGGGAARQLVPPGDGESLTGPFWLPERRALLFASTSQGRIEALVDGERKVIFERPEERAFDPLVSPSGHLVFRLQGGRSASGIWAVPFSIDRLETTGEPFQLLPLGRPSMARNGTVAFRLRQSDLSPMRLVDVDRKGTIVSVIGDPLPGLGTPAISPDGTQIAASFRDEEDGDLVVFDRRTGGRYVLEDAAGRDWSPFWTKDGTSIIFRTWGAGTRHVRERSRDGSGQVRLLDDRSLAAAESPEGNYLVTSFYETLYRENGSEETKVLFDEAIIELDFSPDGRWIVYQRLGQPGLFLRRFPEGDSLTPVTSSSATNPRFSADGSELFYWQGDSLVAVPIDMKGSRPRIGQPEALFSAAENRFVQGWSSFDVMPGGRFLMTQQLEAAPEPEADPGIVILQNWDPVATRAEK